MNSLNSESLPPPDRRPAGLRARSVRSTGLLLTLSIGLFVGGAALIRVLRGPASSVGMGEWGTAPHPSGQVPPLGPPLSAGGSVTVRLKQDHFTPWPPNPQVIGPSPGATGSGPGKPESQESKKDQPAGPPRPSSEPPVPTAEELKRESARDGDELSAEDARAVLLDERRSSALKLAVIDKLRTQAPQEAVPLLVAFLDAPAGASGAYTKPTAIRVLKDFQDPRAEEALLRLARSSPDERVRLTIAALEAKEKSR
jgi:hypothetical protein